MITRICLAGKAGYDRTKGIQGRRQVGWRGHQAARVAQLPHRRELLPAHRELAVEDQIRHRAGDRPVRKSKQGSRVQVCLTWGPLS